ncbi:MAG: UvrB/UvrC motif-containing protein [Verrucomicrobiota bacterium]
MECNFCHSQEATIFLSQIFKGEIIKLDLCEACAKKLEVTDVQGVAVNELIDKIKLIQEESRHDAEQVCSCCDMSLDEMKKRGQLGCPECYDAFGEAVSSILQENQKGKLHSGKIPKGMETLAQQSRRDLLELDLQRAVESENFEQAARLRDELNQSE